jgi:hypothetical protein
MKALERNKGLIVAVVILGITMFLYRSFIRVDYVVDVDAATRETGANLVDTRSRLEAVSLDQSVFSIESFKRLSDFSVPVPEQPIGRPNPFNVLGRN